MVFLKFVFVPSRGTAPEVLTLGQLPRVLQRNLVMFNLLRSLLLLMLMVSLLEAQPLVEHNNALLLCFRPSGRICLMPRAQFVAIEAFLSSWIAIFVVFQRTPNGQLTPGKIYCVRDSSWSRV